MEKKLFTLVALLMCFLGVRAADPPGWADVSAFDGSRYSKECVVYADLRDADGGVPSRIDRFIVGAFIDGELRGVAEGIYQSVITSSGTSVMVAYFPMRIHGENSDNGKTVEFRLVERSESLLYVNTYKVQGAEPVKFKSESTVGGTPSNLYHLIFNKPTTITLSLDSIVLNVGETIDLTPLIKVMPQNANVPQDVSFSAGNYVQYFDVIDGHTLKALKSNAKEPYQMYIGIDAQDYWNWNAAQVIVRQPITGLTLKDEYKDGITVNVGDSETLSGALAACYTMTPQNATEVPVWSPSDPEAITQMPGATNMWSPQKTGDYTMTLTAANASLTVSVHIVQPVSGLTATLTDIYVNVGDEVTALLKVDTKVLLANATNPVINYQILESSPNSPLQRQDDGTIIAVAVGKQEVMASNPDVPNDPVIYTINVQPNVTSLTVKNSELSVLWAPDGNGEQDITAEVTGNIVMAPTANYSPQYLTMDPIDATVIRVTSQGTAYQVSALTKGSTLLSLLYSYQETVVSGTALANVSQYLKEAFTVNIVEGLTGFTASDIKMGNHNSDYLTLTPVPADATYDPSLIRVEDGTTDKPDGWTICEISSVNDNNLVWNIRPRSITKNGKLNVYYGTELLSVIPLEIAQDVMFYGGWQWKTCYGGSLEGLLTTTNQWDVLQELRTSDRLLYNDKVYGYFGTLSRIPRGQCFKSRFQDDAKEYMMRCTSEIYAPMDPSVLTLTLRWSWMGYPYQYDHPIADVLGQSGQTFTKGDRIVSLDNFAEFDGNKWTGTLTTLKGGEGYMFYNAGSSVNEVILPTEAELGQPDFNATPAKRMGSSVWTYNSGLSADNMTIVADVLELCSKDGCSIGAFVGDECRGKGEVVDGKFFITVHGTAGENISFKLYDPNTQEFWDIDRTLPFADMAGNIAQPVTMKLGEVTTIDAIDLGRSGIAVIAGKLCFGGLSVKHFRVCAVNGVVVLENESDLSGLSTGIYLVKVVTADGKTLTKKIVR